MLNYAKTGTSFLLYLHRVLIKPPDMMTTDSSSSPFAQDELVAILDLVNSLRGTSSRFALFLDIVDFQRRCREDYRSIQYMGRWYDYTSLHREVVLISYEARLMAYFSEYC